MADLFVPQNVGNRRPGLPAKPPPGVVADRFNGEDVKCFRCGDQKPRTIENFACRATKRNGNTWWSVSGVCRACEVKRAMTQVRNKRADGWKPPSDPRSADEHRRRNLEKAYGLTVEQYSEMLAAQGGVCKICLEPSRAIRQGKLRPLFVDHNHKTGKIRGLLCMSCNAAISQARDNVEVLKAAIKYLEEADG